MKPLFTIDAGEYIVGSRIEHTYKDDSVWVPAKDTGVDLLILNRKERKTAGLQVKASKDHLPHKDAPFLKSPKCCGWITINKQKLAITKADLWVFVLSSFKKKTYDCLIVDSKKLLARYRSIFCNQSHYSAELWINNIGKCFETRDLSKKDKLDITKNEFKNRKRDFTKYVERWPALEDLINLKA